MNDTQETLPECIARLGLSVTSKFVPFSKSRNAKESHRSLNWRVTVHFNNPDYGPNWQDAVVSTDYSAGIAHCPAYKATTRVAGGANSMLRSEAIKHETENGRKARFAIYGLAALQNGAPILPDSADVIYSLILDSDVLEYSSFEEWASSFGYDPDSRNAESIYRACLEIALQLRNGLPKTVLDALRAAAQDY